LLNNLGILANDRGGFGAARDYYHRSLTIYRRLGLPSQLAAVLSNVGATEINDGAPERARAALIEALQIQRELSEQFHAANTLHNLAEMHRRLGDFWCGPTAYGGVPRRASLIECPSRHC
jgi:tetratricopeptide (TPR) repeat protein